MKLAVLSNINIDPLKNSLQKRSFDKLYFAGFNSWQSELLNASSFLHSFQPDYVFIYLDAGEFKSDISELLSCIETYFQHMNSTKFIISNFADIPYSVRTYSGKNDRIRLMNDMLDDFSSDKSWMSVLDFHRLVQLHGYKHLFSEKYWYLGRIKFSNLGFDVLSNEISNLILCLSGKVKKVLILDLDNTLWGGIVGEDGYENVLISEEGAGRIFADFQRTIKQLKDIGILLVSCSKNNESDAREVFEKRPEMQLSWGDFVLHQISFEEKSKSIAQIADFLQLGLNSMVFIDDSTRERDLIRQAYPEVIVPDFPEDISILNQWFILDVVYPYFPKKRLTEEDLEKTNQYIRNISRTKVRQALTYDEFLSSLQIQLKVFNVEKHHAPRISQLTQKTNQFNLTTKPYTDLEIENMLQNKDFKLYACEYYDKFGKEGTIACAIVQLDGEKAIIDTFLLSCRVLGRNVENNFLEHIITDLKQTNIKKVEGIYIPASKNIPVKDFYQKNGFKPLDNQHFILELDYGL